MTKYERLSKLISTDMANELKSGKTVEIKYTYDTYGVSVILTYNKKRICSRSGANYDRLGAAFGDVVEYIDTDALRRLLFANLPEFKECLYARDGEMHVYGAVGMSVMVSLMRDMGYAVDYNSRNTSTGKCSGVIYISRKFEVFI